MPGLADAAAALCLNLVVPGDVQPVSGAAAGAELPGFDPVVDDPGAAAELAGGLGDADFVAGGGERGCRERAGTGGPAQPRWADWAILVRLPASAWAFQGMQNRLAEPRRAVSCPVWIQW
jgi:hypothetical protein